MKRSNRLVLLVGIFLAVLAFVGISRVAGQRAEPEPADAGPDQDHARHRAAGHPTRVRHHGRHGRHAGRHPGRTGVVQRLQGPGPGHRPDRPPGGQGRPGDHLGHDPGRRPSRASATRSRSPRASAPSRSRSTRSPASARSSSRATTSTWSSASPATSSRSSSSTRHGQLVTVVAGLNGTSVKLLLAGHAGPRARCSRRRPRRPTARPRRPRRPAPGLAQRPAGDRHPRRSPRQQAEVIKFAQLDGSISLVLRSAEDFFDPTTGQPDPGRSPDGPPASSSRPSSTRLRRPAARARRGRPPGAARSEAVTTRQRSPGDRDPTRQRDGRDGPAGPAPVDAPGPSLIRHRHHANEPSTGTDRPMADQIRVLIVDDIPETRDHLTKLLGFESDIDVVGLRRVRHARRSRSPAQLLPGRRPDGHQHAGHGRHRRDRAALGRRCRPPRS